MCQGPRRMFCVIWRPGLLFPTGKAIEMAIRKLHPAKQLQFKERLLNTSLLYGWCTPLPDHATKFVLEVLQYWLMKGRAGEARRVKEKTPFICCHFWLPMYYSFPYTCILDCTIFKTRTVSFMVRKFLRGLRNTTLDLSITVNNRHHN